MSGWAGFSEAELRHIQSKDSGMPAATARGRKPPPANRSRQQLQRERALQMSAQKNSGTATSPGLPPEQQLSKPPPKEERRAQPVVPASAPAVIQDVKQEPTEVEPSENHHVVPVEETHTVKELEKQDVEMREKTRLELLQQEQKLIEERNKRKKALLAKTIAEKSKQTQAEAVKLKRIQKELQALDDMVSNDIGILRNRIEQASWDYSAARKRYEKAEAEYVAAKMDLHRKTEVKEQLTEHLCAIIQQNELRKAHKLEELMQQLQLQATEEELEKLKEEEKREEEEEEKKRRICEETHRNGSVENKEETVQSTKECKALEEEKGGDVQQEQKQLMAEEAKAGEDCTTVENGVEKEAAA